MLQYLILSDVVADIESGGAICGSFLIFGGLSILLYKPWRRRIDRRRRVRYQPRQILDEQETEMSTVLGNPQVDGKEVAGNVERIQSRRSLDNRRLDPSRDNKPEAAVEP